MWAIASQSVGLVDIYLNLHRFLCQIFLGGDRGEEMAVKIKDIISLIDKFAPQQLAAEWDRVGLQLGNPEAEVERVLIALDVNPQVIEEAYTIGASLIVSHHPLIRGDIQSPYLVPSDPAGGCLLKAAQMGISIFVAHTNLDKTPGGVSDILSTNLGLKDIEILLPEEAKDLYKLVVFVPESAVSNVLSAISRAGAGIIGNYTFCSFRANGIGTFKPEKGAEPTIGKRMELNEVHEYRLETQVPSHKLDSVLEAMIKAHPYEEVAYDIYQIRNPSLGFGRIGNLREGISLEEYLGICREKLEPKSFRVIGDSRVRVKRIAVCGGGGAELIPQAKAKGADLFLTGDVKYHQAQLAKSLELVLVDAGHNATERVILPVLVSLIEESGLGIEAVESKIETDPWDKVISYG